MVPRECIPLTLTDWHHQVKILVCPTLWFMNMLINQSVEQSKMFLYPGTVSQSGQHVWRLLCFYAWWAKCEWIWFWMGLVNTVNTLQTLNGNLIFNLLYCKMRYMCIISVYLYSIICIMCVITYLAYSLLPSHDSHISLSNKSSNLPTQLCSGSLFVDIPFLTYCNRSLTHSLHPHIVSRCIF